MLLQNTSLSKIKYQHKKLISYRVSVNDISIKQVRTYIHDIRNGLGGACGLITLLEDRNSSQELSELADVLHSLSIGFGVKLRKLHEENYPDNKDIVLQYINSTEKELDTIVSQIKQLITNAKKDDIEYLHDAVSILVSTKETLYDIYGMSNEKEVDIDLVLLINNITTALEARFKNDVKNYDLFNIYTSGKINAKTLHSKKSALLNALTNILKNSYEANSVIQATPVYITIHHSNKSFNIVVSNVGVMPRHIVDAVKKHKSTMGMTRGKEDGHGYGLANAIKGIEEAGGSYEVNVEIGSTIPRTIQIIRFPNNNTKSL